MTREEKHNETPRKEKMQEALAHYDEIATKACWHRSDIPDAIRAYYTPLPPAEGAKTCWNCGIDLRYSPNGVTEYHCVCGAVDPGERLQQQPPAEGAENCWNCGIDLRNAPDGVTKHHCICGATDPGERQQQPTAEGAEEIGVYDIANKWAVWVKGNEVAARDSMVADIYGLLNVHARR